jgi:predicted RND superfamily exporter protein
MSTPSPSGSSGLGARFFDALARQQLTRPWTVLVLVFVSASLAGSLALRLELRTSFGELLPANKESVVIAEQVNERLPAMSTLVIVAEGSDNAGLKRFVDALAPELKKLPPELVGQVDEGVGHTQAFFEKNKLLYAPLDLLQEIHDLVEERYQWEVGKRTGTLIDDEEPPPLDEKTISDRVEQHKRKSAPESGPKYPDGYYMSEEDHTIAVRILTPLGVGDLEETETLKTAVRDAIDRVGPQRFDPSMRVGLSGNLLKGAETYSQIKGDLAEVGIWGVVLILGVVLLYYLRLRTLLAMAIAAGVGTVWTFAVTYLAIGHLNSSTGFLVSVVVGNGINFGIIYMARYLEERRSTGVAESLRAAHAGTWAGTLGAATVGAGAYGSLVVTDFRGFKHFGLIGGSGMLLCWLATFVVLPAFLVVSERIAPIPPPRGLLARLSALYGRPFAALATRAPHVALAIGALLTIGAGYLSYRYFTSDPMEYDMTRIDNNVEEQVTEVTRLNRIANAIVGRAGQDGLAIAVDRLDQVLPLKAELDKRRAAAEKPPFNAVVTIFGLLPSDQERKIALLKETREIVDRAHAKGFVSDKDMRKLGDLLPKKLTPIGIGDLPDEVAASFTEVDGTRGRLVYIVPADGESVWDGRYLIRWAESFRSTTLPDGSVVKGSGRSVIFADMISAIVEDAPKAMVASLALSLLIVLLAFRGGRAGLWVVGSVLVGLSWMIAVLALWHSRWPWQEGGFALSSLKLNFLNFIALPLTLGVGADYAVNIMKRWQLDGETDVHELISETGGAVILCSLTTMLGYVALTMSVNRAIQSFGIASAAGEICCLLVAVLVLPSALVLRSRARRRAPALVAAPAEAEVPSRRGAA